MRQKTIKKSDGKLHLVNRPEEITCIVRETEDKDVITISFSGLLKDPVNMDDFLMEMELGEQYINLAFNSLTKEIDCILVRAAIEKICEDLNKHFFEVLDEHIHDWCIDKSETEEELENLIEEETDRLYDQAKKLIEDIKGIDISKIKVNYKRIKKIA